MSLSELRRRHREEILRLAAEYGAHNVRVFGSTLAGDAGPVSDVDLLVDLEPGRSLFDLGGFLMDVQDVLGCPVDVVTERGLHWSIRDEVLQKAIAL